MASPQSQHNIVSIAERIVQARRLYGPDSAYIIGLFQGLELAYEGDGSALRAKIQDQVLRLESGKGAKAPAPAKSDSGGSRPAPAGNELAENTWVRGAVKWFNNDKGYGFISTAANTDVFVHWRDISSWDRSLTQGDEVEFMVTKTAKGFQAINVMKPGADGDDSGRLRQEEGQTGGEGGREAADSTPAEGPSAGAATAEEPEADGSRDPVAPTLQGDSEVQGSEAGEQSASNPAGSDPDPAGDGEPAGESST